MTNDQLRSAFKAQSYVRWDGIQQGGRYFLQGIIAQWINGQVVTSAILMDNSKAIYQVKPNDLKEIK